MLDLNAFLMENGFTAEEVAGLTEKQKKVFAVALGKFEEGSTALTKSAAEVEAAKAEREEAAKFWEEKVTPALAGVDKRVATADSETARYKAYLTSLKAQGYDVPDNLLTIPVSDPTKRDPETGKFVTPEQMAKEFSATGPTLISLTQLSNEYTDLYGAPYLSMETDFAEAQAARKPFRDFVRDKYKFAGKREEREIKKRDELIEQKANEKFKTREAELVAKYGSNADLRSPLPSKFDKLEKNVGENKDSWKTNSGREAARKDRLERFKNVILQ